MKHVLGWLALVLVAWWTIITVGDHHYGQLFASGAVVGVIALRTRWNQAKRVRAEMSALAARADAQHWALSVGNTDLGFYGVRPESYLWRQRPRTYR